MHGLMCGRQLPAGVDSLGGKAPQGLTHCYPWERGSAQSVSCLTGPTCCLVVRLKQALHCHPQELPRLLQVLNSICCSAGTCGQPWRPCAAGACA